MDPAKKATCFRTSANALNSTNAKRIERFCTNATPESILTKRGKVAFQEKTASQYQHPSANTASFSLTNANALNTTYAKTVGRPCASVRKDGTLIQHCWIALKVLVKRKEIVITAKRRNTTVTVTNITHAVIKSGSLIIVRKVNILALNFSNVRLQTRLVAMEQRQRQYQQSLENVQMMFPRNGLTSVTADYITSAKTKRRKYRLVLGEDILITLIRYATSRQKLVPSVKTAGTTGYRL
jgi:hypothetical protein